MAENIKSYTTESEKFSEKCQEAKGRVEGITKELDELDRRLKKLQPRLKLDQLEEKCGLIRSVGHGHVCRASPLDLSIFWGWLVGCNSTK